MVKLLACDSRGHKCNSRLLCCQVTTLGKLFAHMCLCHVQYNLVPVARQLCPATGKVTIGMMSHWSCVPDLSGLSTYGLKA